MTMRSHRLPREANVIPQSSQQAHGGRLGTAWRGTKRLMRGDGWLPVRQEHVSLGSRYMHFKHIMVAILITLIGLSVWSIAGITSYYTERPVEELKLMTEPELAGEARLVCLDIQARSGMAKKYSELKSHDLALQEYEMQSRSRKYLERVGFVLRDRHQGKMPGWFDQVGSASKSDEKQSCDEAAIAGGWHK
jgi:hypothetical protein